jgi:hypothetical protein
LGGVPSPLISIPMGRFGWLSASTATFLKARTAQPLML